MTVADIIREHGVAEFATHLRALIEAKGFKLRDFRAAVYGVVNGKPGGSGAIYTVLGGSQRPTNRFLERIAPALEMSGAELIAQRDAAFAGLAAKPPSKPPAAKPTPAPGRLVALPAAPAVEPPSLTLQVRPDGLASLRLSLDGVPVTEAIRALNALVACGIVPGAAPG